MPRNVEIYYSGLRKSVFQKQNKITNVPQKENKYEAKYEKGPRVKGERKLHTQR